MAITIKETESKITAAKKNIKLTDILVQYLKFVDADGEDLTQKFIDALPGDTETVELKVSFELLPGDENTEE